MAVVLTLGAAACGDSSDGDAGTTTPTTAVADMAFDATTQAALTSALDASFAEVKAPGAIVAVRQGDRTWTAIRGVADTTTETVPTLDDHTRIGSITKTLTGTLILQLVDQGQLSLDDTIEPWFPDLPDGGQITVRQLGEMSSGIDSYTTNDATTDEYFADPQKVWTPEELVAVATALPRKFPPGEGFLYSNTNAIMLGMIVEQVTGKPLEQAYQEMIFDPLGLDQSSYPSGTELTSPSWSGYTDQPDGVVVDATNWSPTFAGAAGQVESTLADMLVWAKALGTGSLLSAETQQSRLQANPASVKGTRQYDFAVGQENGWLAHSGELPGFNSQVAYLPGEDISIVVLTNADIAGANGNPAPTLFAALAAAIAPANAP